MVVFARMAHALIVYNLLVIMLGCTALAVFATRGVQLRARGTLGYSLAFGGFTAMLILIVADKYVVTNLDGFALYDLFVLRGVKESVHVLMVAAVGSYFHYRYWPDSGPLPAVVFAIAGVAAMLLVFLPGGARFAETERIIELGPLYFVAMTMSLLVFGYAVVLGLAVLLKNGAETDRAFQAAFLLFITFGFAETAISFLKTLDSPFDTFASSQGGFILSSVPYAAYSIFVLLWHTRTRRTENSTTPEAADRVTGDSEESRFRAFARDFELTLRETEVAALVIAGKSNHEIAARLFVSLATVKSHVHNLYAKTGVRGRFGLMQKAASFKTAGGQT